jgi:hypothetical protein
MKHGEESDAGAQMFRVAGNGEQGFGGGVEQDVVNRLLVVEGYWGDLLGDSKNDVEVFHRQQFGLPAFEPLGPLRALTLRTVAVAARVVSVAFFSAVVAFFEVATEGRLTTGRDAQVYLSGDKVGTGLRQSSAYLDGPHDTQLLQRKLMSFPVSSSVRSKNIGHFESGPRHPESISGASVSA